MSEFIAFRAAIALLHDRGMDDIIDKVYQECRRQLELPVEEQTNAVKAIYEPFSDEEISDKMVHMLKPAGVEAEIKIVYQSIQTAPVTGIFQAIIQRRAETGWLIFHLSIIMRDALKNAPADRWIPIA